MLLEDGNLADDNVVVAAVVVVHAELSELCSQ
jgi:hypothetical protein